MESARLSVITRGNAREFTVTPGAAVTIGRSSKCTVTLRDPKVSRVHCKLLFERGQVVVVDLDSAHGIDHLGERKAMLSIEPGDGFRLGDSFVRFDAIRTGPSSVHAAGSPVPGGTRTIHGEGADATAAADGLVDWRTALSSTVTGRRTVMPLPDPESATRPPSGAAAVSPTAQRRSKEVVARSSSKALLARLAGESIVFTIHMALCVVLLVALRAALGFDLYRSLGLD